MEGGGVTPGGRKNPCLVPKIFLKIKRPSVKTLQTLRKTRGTEKWEFRTTARRKCKAKNFQENKKGLLHKQKANSEELFV